MIHYHGTPIGGKRTDVVSALQGRHGLVSFARDDDLPVVMEVCQSFVLDNGAFSLWRKGGEVDFDAYYSWVRTIYQHPGFDWCLIPDRIDGTKEDNEQLIVKWLRIGSRIKGVPIWHFHEPLEWLEWLVDDFEWVALGSSGKWPNPGRLDWWLRMTEIMGVCCDSKGRPKCKLHGLRMLDPRLFSRIPLASADATNIARNNNHMTRFGMYPPPTAGQRAAVIANRIESHNSAAIWEPFPQIEMDLPESSPPLQVNE